MICICTFTQVLDLCTLSTTANNTSNTVKEKLKKKKKKVLTAPD